MFWSSIVKKRVLKRLGCLKKFVFLEQLRLTRWGERLLRNYLMSLSDTEEIDKDLLKIREKAWSLIYICLGVRSGLCNWSFYSQIFLKLFPFTKKDNKVWFLVFFHIFCVLCHDISNFFIEEGLEFWESL